MLTATGGLLILCEMFKFSSPKTTFQESTSRNAEIHSPNALYPESYVVYSSVGVPIPRGSNAMGEGMPDSGAFRGLCVYGVFSCV